MSPILLLTGLLALAYFGSMLVGRRTIQGFGLPSGTEFLLLGILLGPRFVGVFTRQGLAGFEALTIGALSWFALVIGSHYGHAGARRVSGRRMLGGLVLATMVAVFAAAPVVGLALLLTDLGAHDLAVLGLGVGAVSAETTRYAVRWVVQRYAAQGPLTDLLADTAEADDAVPIVLLGVLGVIAEQKSAISLPGMPWSGLLAMLGIGGALGATCAALFDIEPRTSQRWGILLGTGLLTVGVTVRLGLSPITATFVMGVVAATLAKQRQALQELFGLSERAVMLPVLVVAGAYISFPEPMPFIPIAVAAVLARAVGKMFAGRLLARAVDPSGSTSLGLAMVPAGVLSIAVGLAFVLRFPGRISEWVLAIAALHAVLGEIAGTALMHRALRRAGEISEPSAGAVTIAPPAPAPFARAKLSRATRTSTVGPRGEDRVRSSSVGRGEDRVRSSSVGRGEDRVRSSSVGARAEERSRRGRGSSP